MHDLILVGGGLANGLIALRLKLLRPELKILLLEQGATLGGNHTWSFYQHDLTPQQHDWIAPPAARSSRAAGGAALAGLRGALSGAPARA